MQEIDRRQSLVNELGKGPSPLSKLQDDIRAVQQRYAPERISMQLRDAGIQVTSTDELPALPATAIIRVNAQGSDDAPVAAAAIRSLDYPVFLVTRFETLPDAGWTATIEATTPRFHPVEPDARLYTAPKDSVGVFGSSKEKELRRELSELETRYDALGAQLADAGHADVDRLYGFYLRERDHLKILDDALSKQKPYVPEDIDALSSNGPFKYGTVAVTKNRVEGDAWLKPSLTRDDATRALPTAEQVKADENGRVRWVHPMPKK